MTEDHPNLIRVGNLLEGSVARAIAAGQETHRRRRRLRRSAGTVAVAAGLAGIGWTAASAAGLLSADTVEAGLPGGAIIFQGTDPSCTTEDEAVFDCRLSTAPIDETGGATWVGVKEGFVDENNIVAGGCEAQDFAGMHWLCYAGHRAIEEGIIGPLALGQHLSGLSGG